MSEVSATQRELTIGASGAFKMAVFKAGGKTSGFAVENGRNLYAGGIVATFAKLG